MILSVSKRTDIPAFYSEWFIDKIQKGYVCVRNPMNREQISRIALDPKLIDCIVFWTKNPERMLPYLDILDKRGFLYYFTFTLNYYGPDIEPNLANIQNRIETFIKLSKKIGKERVIWRYDPIVITKTYTPHWHAKCFDTLCNILADYTEKAVVSIVDIYPNKNQNILNQHGFRVMDAQEKYDLFQNLADSAIAKHGLTLATCAEDIPEISKLGIIKNRCVDPDLISRLAGKPFNTPKSNYANRSNCGCCENIDIGTYDTCTHGCIYCYACKDKTVIKNRIANYDPKSDILCDKIEPGAKIHDRILKSYF